MNRRTRQRVTTLALTSMLVRLVLVAAFAPLIPSLTNASSGATQSIAGFVSVQCATHGTMQLPATDFGIVDGTTDVSSDQPGKAVDTLPRFCPYCIALTPGMPPIELTNWIATLRPALNPLHPTRDAATPRKHQPHTLAEARAPPLSFA